MFYVEMPEFNVDSEIDQLVDKLAEQLKARLKKIVEKSEKQMLRQYIASQKELAKVKSAGGKVVTKKTSTKRTIPKRESDYSDQSDQSDGVE